MKVIQINAVCGKGSTGRICTELCDTLIKQKHECIILYGNGNSDYDHSRLVSNKLSLKINALWARISGNDMGGAYLETSRIINFLHSYRPDVVHLHNLHGNYVNLPMLCRYLTKKDIATVVTLHDCWYFTAKCTHYTTTACYRWQTGCHDCPRLKQDIPSWFFDRTRQMWSIKRNGLLSIPRLAVTGVSDWITNEANQSFLRNASFIKRIYNWIDLSVFYPRKGDLRSALNLPTDKFLILCISDRWDTTSLRFRDLMALASALPRNSMIILAGTIPQEILWPDNVITIGYISSTDLLAQLYSAVDVYVHLSHEDTFGKVTAEAMACGTPAIVYQSTASPELVPDGSGYSIEAGNIKELVFCIQKVQKKGKSAYSDTCIYHTRKNFKKETLIEETISLYKDMLTIPTETKKK